MTIIQTDPSSPGQIGHGDNDVLVRVENVSKKFCRSLKRSLWYGVKDIISDLNPLHLTVPDRILESAFPSEGELKQPHQAGNGLRPDEFWAVNGVSFELRRGECLGLIGRNGAGKTTLLKLLNGLMKPDTGRITMKGRIGALIALGAGFNPVLSGRENIYVNGAVLGFTKREIDEKLDDIIAFSEISEFIDSPVRTYSSGMQVRLGFAVATAMDPDVLILDEVLAVGDASFRHKCYNRINKIIKKCAVILVSHGMEQIAAVSSQIGMMQNGTFTLYKDITEGIGAYNNANVSRDDSAENEAGVLAWYPPIESASLQFDNTEARYGGGPLGGNPYYLHGEYRQSFIFINGGKRSGPARDELKRK